MDQHQQKAEKELKGQTYSFSFVGKKVQIELSYLLLTILLSGCTVTARSHCVI